MGKLISVDIVASETMEGLNIALNKKIEEIQKRNHEVVIQYADPAYNSIEETFVWSALVEERETHPF